MPKTKSSRVYSKSVKKRHLNPWLVIIFVCIIAVAGIVILRFSHADSGNTTVVLKPTDSNVQVCTFAPASQELHVCYGQFVDTADGKAWQTSVNQLNNFNWFGPYEKLTAWPDNSQKSVNACVTLRDNIPFGITAQYVFDITTNDGTRTLASRTISGQDGAFKTSASSLTIQCLSANLPANVYPADYSHVEYRIRVLRGSVNIYQMARTLSGTVTSSMVQPTTSQPQGMSWPVNPAIAEMRGPNSPGGSGCYGAVRNGNRHEGVDLIGTGGLNVVNGNLYNEQIDVVAAQAGTVVNVNTPPDPGGYGNFVIIKHNDQLYTLYGHLSSIGVSVGQQVSQGQVIGRTGETGNAGPIKAGFVHTGNQVHFQVMNAYNGSAGIPFGNTINPSDLISQPINRNGC